MDRCFAVASTATTIVTDRDFSEICHFYVGRGIFRQSAFDFVIVYSYVITNVVRQLNLSTTISPCDPIFPFSYCFQTHLGSWNIVFPRLVS